MKNKRIVRALFDLMIELVLSLCIADKVDVHYIAMDAPADDLPEVEVGETHTGRLS